MWYPILMTVLVSYLLGNLNGAVSISTLVAHDDVRGHGSGNAGLTNFARSYGGWNSVLVALIDFGKTALACLLGGLLLKPYDMSAEGMVLGGVCVSLGHDFPALLGFRGGKGIMCGIAAAFVIDWRIALIVLGSFLLVYLISGYVSMGSIMGAVAYIAGFLIWRRQEPLVMAGGIFLGLLAIFMHRTNIVRLIKGEESRTPLFHRRDRK